MFFSCSNNVFPTDNIWFKVQSNSHVVFSCPVSLVFFAFGEFLSSLTIITLISYNLLILSLTLMFILSEVGPQEPLWSGLFVILTDLHHYLRTSIFSGWKYFWGSSCTSLNESWNHLFLCFSLLFKENDFRNQIWSLGLQLECSCSYGCSAHRTGK